jgi:iron(III) transport system substrate-binding protein
MRYLALFTLTAWLVAACAAPAAPPAAPAGGNAPAAPPARPAETTASPGASASGELDPQLVEAARREGSVVWYTSVDLSVAQTMAQAFTAKYGIPAEVNRNGSERVFAQFMKETETGVNTADVVHTSDTSNYVEMKEKGYLAPYRPAAADHLLAEYRDRLADPQDQWFGLRITVCNVVYNTNLVKPEDLPRSWKEFADPRYRGKLVVSHPSYSGVTLTYIQALLGLYGWDYFKGLADTDPLVVQSIIDVTSKVVSGERPIGVGSNDYSNYAQIKRGQPIQILQMSEGVPFVVSPQGISKTAPHPNAAKLFHEYTLSPEAQTILVNEGGVYSVRSDIALPADHTPLKDIKLLFTDPQETNRVRASIQRQFGEIFGF